MQKSIIAEVLAITCMFAPAAWSQATTPARQTIRYFTTPLEKDPTREVEMVSITVPPGDGNYVPRGTIHRQQNLSDKPARYIVMNIFDKGKPVAEPVPE